MKQAQRSFGSLPLPLRAVLLLALLLQPVFNQLTREPYGADFQHLSPALDVSVYRVLSLGSDRLFSYLLMLGVQLHDNQKGEHVSYRHLDYHVLSKWLLTLYRLNPDSDYPGFMATRVYSQVSDEAKLRRMVQVVERLFEQNPQQHWRRMTEACLILKHQLHDLNAALKLAEKVAALPPGVKMPFWARDMKLILLDELNQYESAQLLISSLLESGSITDPDEVRFLQRRLLKIQQALLKSKQT